ncbi:MAG: hypothetical protein OET79_15670, partial [Nitrospirota bacterium]|nr:hypothetical protein [Nitrospirota bacterium]
MTHGRQKAALGAAGFFGVRDGGGQLVQQGRGVGRQDQECDPQTRRQSRHGTPEVGERDDHREAEQTEPGRDEQVATAIAKPHTQADPQEHGVEGCYQFATNDHA